MVNDKIKLTVLGVKYISKHGLGIEHENKTKRFGNAL